MRSPAPVGRAAFGGNVHFVIRSRHGKRIQDWSAYCGELEVLFSAGTRFRVLRVTLRPGGGAEIELEELELRPRSSTTSTERRFPQGRAG